MNKMAFFSVFTLIYLPRSQYLAPGLLILLDIPIEDVSATGTQLGGVKDGIIIGKAWIQSE